MIGYFISECGAKSVYDPCAGLCSFAILPELNEVDFVCSELNPRTKVIADIRLNAAGKHLEINQEDSTFNWRGNSNCDCLASELPFGLRLNDRSLDERRSLLLEDFVLDKFIESESLTSAVLLVSASTCVRGNNFRCRKQRGVSGCRQCKRGRNSGNHRPSPSWITGDDGAGYVPQ